MAEAAKLLENTFRSVNIALANEFTLACRKIGVDPWEVIEAAATKAFGFMPFYPGPGIGGHCIPVDPHHMSWLTAVEPSPRALAATDCVLILTNHSRFDYAAIAVHAPHLKAYRGPGRSIFTL